MVFAVVDGLGHGAEAAKVTAAGLEVMGNDDSMSVLALVKLCNEALKQTRGLTISIASLDFNADEMTWLAIGNVDAVLLRANPEKLPPTQNVLQRGGVVGYQMPNLQSEAMRISPGDLLIFSTDGIRPGFVTSIVRKDPVAHIAHSILNNFFKGTDDALVLVARYHGRKP